MSRPQQDTNHATNRSVYEQNVIQPYRYSELQDPRNYVRLLRATIDPQYGRHEYNLDIFPIASLFGSPDKLTYYAVSYEWGSPDPLKSILVNSQLLSVRNNLYDFLQRIQNKIRAGTFRSDYWLWIDAICINQADIDEKAAQVSLMQRIFSNAGFVLAWLGPGGCFEARDLRWNILIAADGIDEKSYNCLGATYKSANLVDSIRQSEAVQRVAELLETDFYDELSFMLSLSFWSRRWILQEIGLAWSVVVMCGDVEIRWSDIKKLFCLLRLHFQNRGHNPLQRCLAWRLWELEVANLVESEPEVDYLCQLNTILIALSESECELDVDRVYVVANLMSSQSIVVPAYTDSASKLFCSIFLKGARFNLSSLLSYFPTGSSEDAKYRQWAQDYLTVAQELRLISTTPDSHFQVHPQAKSTYSIRCSQSAQYELTFVPKEQKPHSWFEYRDIKPITQLLRITIQSRISKNILPESALVVRVGDVDCVHRLTHSMISAHDIAITYPPWHEEDNRPEPKVKLVSNTEISEDQWIPDDMIRATGIYHFCSEMILETVVNIKSMSTNDMLSVDEKCKNQGTVEYSVKAPLPLWTPPPQKYETQESIRLEIPYTVNLNVCSSDLLAKVLVLSAEPKVV